MSTYSPVVILFIIVQFVSLLLLASLMVIILKSKPYFTKWTLFQVCISEFAYGLTSIPILIYGDELVARAFDSPWCIIMQKISLYFIFPLEFFSYILAFYLWYALVKRDLDIEKKCFWYISSATWIYTTVYNLALLSPASKAPHWGALASDYGCKTSTLIYSVYGYIIPTSILTFFAVLMTIHSAIILWKRHSDFSSIQNRRTAIKLGEAVRLCAYCFSYVALMVIPLVPRAIQGDSSDINYFRMMETVGYFGGAIVGTVLFLIFGTDRRAAFFLPFYYVPPDKSQRPQFSFTDERIEVDMNHLDDEISQMSKAYLRQDTSDVNNNYYSITSNSESYNEEDSNHSIGY